MRNFKTRVEFLSYFLSKMLEIIQNIFPHYMAPLSRVFFFLCVTVLSLTSDLLHLEISAVMPFAPLLLSEVAVALFTLLLTFFSFGSLSERSSFLWAHLKGTFSISCFCVFGSIKYKDKACGCVGPGGVIVSDWAAVSSLQLKKNPNLSPWWQVRLAEHVNEGMVDNC